MLNKFIWLTWFIGDIVLLTRIALVDLWKIKKQNVTRFNIFVMADVVMRNILLVKEPFAMIHFVIRRHQINFMVPVRGIWISRVGRSALFLFIFSISNTQSSHASYGGGVWSIRGRQNDFMVRVKRFGTPKLCNDLSKLVWRTLWGTN